MFLVSVFSFVLFELTIVFLNWIWKYDSGRPWRVWTWIFVLLVLV